MYLNIYGVKVDVSSESDLFLRYCSKFLTHFIVNSEFDNKADIKADIVKKKSRPKKRNKTEWTVGKDVARRKDKIIISIVGTDLICEISSDEAGGKSHIVCYSSAGTLKQAWRWLRGRNESRRQLYMTIIRQAILLPVLAQLLTDRGLITLHGAAIAREGRAIILTGLNGCGKSSLAWRLVREHGFHLLSDNFILVDPETQDVYGIPEVLRTKESGLEESGLADIEHLGTAFGKHQYVLPSSVTCLEAKACFLASASIGPEFAIEAASAARFARRSEAMHRHLRETPEYAWTQLYYELEKQSSLGEVAEQSRRQATENVDCYNLTLPRADREVKRYGEATKALKSRL